MAAVWAAAAWAASAAYVATATPTMLTAPEMGSQRQNHTPRTGPAILTAVETTGPAEITNRHSKPLAGPATPLRWRQPAKRSTPATRRARAHAPAAQLAQKHCNNQRPTRLGYMPCGPVPAAPGLHTTGRPSDTHCSGDNRLGGIQPKSSATRIHASEAFALTARAGPVTLTTVETTGPTSNRHSKPPAGPATTLRRTQPARQNAPI